jgi:hypothetical protein
MELVDLLNCQNCCVTLGDTESKSVDNLITKVMIIHNKTQSGLCVCHTNLPGIPSKMNS